MKRILPLVVLSFFALTSCKQDEMDDLAKAQDCLDNVPVADPTAADACMQYVAKYDGQQANILKCSIKMVSGGLVESRFVEAYNALKNESNNTREAVFMSTMALNKPTVNDGYTKAVEANTYCKASGVPGLVYIGNIILVGTTTLKAMNGAGLDVSSPSAIATSTQTMLTDCSANPRGASCPSTPEEVAAVGSAVVTLADSYCNADNSDDEVCENINAAVDAAGGDSTAVANALFCYLNNKTYNPGTGFCN